MKLTDICPAIALTPLDGRYHNQTVDLLANGYKGNGFKTIVDGVNPLIDEECDYLRAIPENFGAEGIKRHAAHEAITHHDVKAVEYYIDDELDKAEQVLGHKTQLSNLKTLVHFACTSEDINNLSIARCVKNAVENVYTPNLKAIVDYLTQKAQEYRDMPMLSPVSYTHLTLPTN